ncbi:Filamentous hemagglutinin transporter [Hirschfeldia incana]|nr:Filamentous hemagglutinin transporter [Hirschfeldia incana]
MAADVSSLVRLLNGYNDDRTVAKESSGAKSTTAPMTRDLLGSRGGVGGDRSLELDLDLQVPTGWEKRLDLKSGKVYLQRCNSTSSSSTITNADQSSNQTVPTTSFQDLNFPPNPTNSHAKPLLNLFDDTSPELKLLPPSRDSRPSRPLSLSPNRNFQSVCTLDKVKSALERAERDPVTFKKRQSPDDHHQHRTEVASPVAAGCPGCLSYVLVMKNNPRCPRCDTVVSLPTNSSSSMKKKVKIDLNISI